MMPKSQIRAKYKLLRLSLSKDDVDQKSKAIATNILDLDIWSCKYFHVFMPIKKQHEVDTSFLIAALREKGKSVVVSKSNFTTMKMSHFLIDDQSVFVKNVYDIPEPVNAQSIAVEKIEIVFVPLLAFDKNGYRVGYGKGFYDRFLANCAANTIFIGLSFFEAESNISDVHENDCKLHFCVLPDKIISF